VHPTTSSITLWGTGWVSSPVDCPRRNWIIFLSIVNTRRSLPVQQKNYFATTSI
jgi:hypothetical protein